jgi:hypothetical protein
LKGDEKLGAIAEDDDAENIEPETGNEAPSRRVNKAYGAILEAEGR